LIGLFLRLLNRGIRGTFNQSTEISVIPVFFIFSKLLNKSFMSLQLKGKVEKIYDIQSGVSKAGNEWKKQEFVIETDDSFARKVCFTLFNDKISLAQGLTPGKVVNVSFNVESREYNGKWFHNINAWQITPAEPDMPEPPPEFGEKDIPPEPDEPINDLPF
jgi:hypothetical protein